MFANNFAASRWMTSKNSATNGSGHEHIALLGAFNVIYKYATNLRQFKKFDQNRSNIHRFIAFLPKFNTAYVRHLGFCFVMADRTH